MRLGTTFKTFLFSLWSLLLLFSAEVVRGQGVLLYWDLNGATANSGSSSPSGTWDTSSLNWTTSAGGTLATVAWNDAVTNNARFSAGTDAVGAYTVTLSGTRTVGQLFINNN